MTVRAVVFDVGGVLEHTPAPWVSAEWEATLGLAPGELDRRMHDVWRAGSVGTVTEAEVRRSVGDRLGLDRSDVEAFMRDLWTEYLGTLNVELADYFGSLRPRYRTAICSNSFVGAREREQQRYGFADLTDLIVYSHEVGVSKPDPRIYRLTCERLGVRPEETVFLDDVEPAVAGAREVGMVAIHFRDNAQAIAELTACLDGAG